MISAKSTLSIKKKDLLNQKTPVVGFQPLYFAHRAALNDTGLNLALLTTPSSEMPSFVQPSIAQLLGANLLFFNKNLVLTSSARGILINKMDYEVVSNTQINFIGFTALANEVFTGVLSDAVSTGVRVVSTAVAPITGTLAANVTDFPVGTTFKAGAFSSSQVGEVVVFLDGLQQYRNTGNSSTTLDANYYEVDPGNGYSNLIRFNSADSVNDRSVTVIYTNAVAERPDGSMMSQIEAIQGQANKLIEVVSDVSGLPESTFRVAPTNQDLKTFGDKVITLQNLETTPGSGLPKLATTSVTGAVFKPNGESYVSSGRTGQPYGSTNTRIRCFLTNQTTTGTAISYTSDTTLGDRWTINEDGIYSITYTDRSNTAANAVFGVSKNGSVSNDIDAQVAGFMLVATTTPTTGVVIGISCIAKLSAGDIIRAHVDNGSKPDSTGNDVVGFRITQLFRL